MARGEAPRGRGKQAIVIFAHTHDGRPDFPQMTPAQLDDLSTAFAREAVTARSEMAYLGSMTAAQKVLEAGSASQEEIEKAIFDSRNPARFGSWNPAASLTQPSPERGIDKSN